MKARLEFDLDDFDDKIAHERCIKSLSMALVIWDLTHNTHRGLTNGFDEDDSYHRGVDAVFSKLEELLDEYDVNIDKLIV